MCPLLSSWLISVRWKPPPPGLLPDPRGKLQPGQCLLCAQDVPALLVLFSSLCPPCLAWLTWDMSVTSRRTWPHTHCPQRCGLASPHARTWPSSRSLWHGPDRPGLRPSSFAAVRVFSSYQSPQWCPCSVNKGIRAPSSTLGCRGAVGCSIPEACVGRDRGRKRTQATGGRSFLRVTLCSSHPLLLVLFLSCPWIWLSRHPPPTANHQSKAFPLPRAPRFKMLQDGLSFGTGLARDTNR